MSSEHINRSLTIRTTISTVTRDQEDTSMHVYTDGSATDAVQDGGAGSFISLPNGQALEAAPATGNYCTNYDAEVKAIEQ